MRFNRESFAHLSFEFFPPKTERDLKNLLRTVQRLQIYEPDFYSVTHGAGASTREGTREVIELLRGRGFNAIPHVSWGDDSEQDILALIQAYEKMGVDRLLLLRGDEEEGVTKNYGVRYGSELVQLVRSHFQDRFELIVACYPEVHPEASSYSEDVSFLKQKVEAGADSCITQYFFNPDAFGQFIDYCKRVNISTQLIPGLMPISNYEKLVRFSDKCGAEIPRWLNERLTDLQGNAEELRTFGASVVADLTRTLLQNGAPGVHYYTLNLARPTITILESLFQDDEG